MATIIARRLKDGSKSYRATIRIMRGNAVLHQETRSFRAKSLAVQWAREREGTLKRHGTGEKAVAALPLAGGISITSLIDRYVREFSSIQRWGRTKDHHLRLLQRLVGERDAFTLTTDQLVGHVHQRPGHQLANFTGTRVSINQRQFPAPDHHATWRYPPRSRRGEGRATPPRAHKSRPRARILGTGHSAAQLFQTDKNPGEPRAAKSPAFRSEMPLPGQTGIFLRVPISSGTGNRGINSDRGRPQGCRFRPTQ